MPLDVERLEELVNEVTARDDAFKSASTANDKAQSAAESAVAIAIGTLATKSSANAERAAAINELIAYVSAIRDDG